MVEEFVQQWVVNGKERLKLFYTNARSWNEKMEELEARMDSKWYDIIAASRT